MTISDNYRALYSSVVDAIQKRGLHIKSSNLSPEGQWTNFVWVKSTQRKWKVYFFSFSYSDKSSMLVLKQRRFLCYRQVWEGRMSQPGDAANVAEEAVSAMLLRVF